MVNLQFIYDKRKIFLTGGKTKGCYFPFYFNKFGEPTKILMICEGFATGYSVMQNFECDVLVAFSAGNLKEVALNAVNKFTWYDEILIAADNDESHVGEKMALEAARVAGIDYIMPDIRGMDFNDYFNRPDL